MRNQKTLYLSTSSISGLFTDWSTAHGIVTLTCSPGLPVSPVAPWGPGRPCEKKEKLWSQQVALLRGTSTKRQKKSTFKTDLESRRSSGSLLSLLSGRSLKKERPSQWWETLWHSHVFLVYVKLSEIHTAMPEGPGAPTSPSLPGAPCGTKALPNSIINCFCAFILMANIDHTDESLICTGSTYDRSGRTIWSFLTALTRLALLKRTKFTLKSAVSFTMHLLRKLYFWCFQTKWLRLVTHAGSFGSGESHNSRLSSGSSRATGSGTSILSRHTLKISTIRRILKRLICWLNRLFRSHSFSLLHWVHGHLYETILKSVLTAGPLFPSGPGLPGLPVIPCERKAIRWVCYSVLWELNRKKDFADLTLDPGAPGAPEIPVSPVAPWAPAGPFAPRSPGAPCHKSGGQSQGNSSRVV